MHTAMILSVGDGFRAVSCMARFSMKTGRDLTQLSTRMGFSVVVIINHLVRRRAKEFRHSILSDALQLLLLNCPLIFP